MVIRNRYSLGQKILLAYWLMRTKILCKRARLIRRPFDLRGRKFIDFGINLTTGVGCRLEAFSENGQPTLHIGKDVQLNDYVHICAMRKVVIGDNVLVAGKVYISDNSHGIYSGSDVDTSPDIPPIQRKYFINPVVIEKNVWLGENVIILPGSYIGAGCIIGANSIVKGNIPASSIAVGAPVRVVKRYDFDCKKWNKVDS